MNRILATGLGIGYFPTAPGTVGSLAAYPIAFVGFQLGGFNACVAITALITIVGFLSVRSYLASANDSDPPEVVIDEIAGQMLALLPVAFWWDLPERGPGVRLAAAGLGAFVLFRVLDIWKPSLIRWADRQPGALGIMLDDIFAGLCAAVVVAGALFGVAAMEPN